MNRLGKPQDGDANDGDAFDQGSDGVSYRRGGGEDDESDDVLGKVDGAVEEEIVHDRVGGGGAFFVITSEIGVMPGSIVCGHEVGEVVVEPDGDHEDEGGSRRIEQEVQFIQFVGGCLVSRGHNLLEEDVGTDEDDGRSKGAGQTEEVETRDIECAHEHDADGEGQKGNVGLWRIANVEEDGVCSDGEQRRQSLDEGVRGRGIAVRGVTYLDGVNGANGDPGDGHAGKDMTAHLESAHGQGCVEDCASGPAEGGEADKGGHEKGAVGGDEEELDKGEGYGVAEVIHDGFSGVGRHGGGGIPDGTLEDESEGGWGRNGSYS